MVDSSEPVVVVDDGEVVPYLICELANSHGGDPQRLVKLVQALGKVNYSRLGVKFQPLSPSTMSLPDYEWHSAYEKLHFSPSVWRDIFGEARKEISDIWLDVLDRYAVEIVGEHVSVITGIKLQPSVLDNREVYAGLRVLDLSDQTLLVNVSGYELFEIEPIIGKFLDLDVKRLVLQLGFQSYPTKLEDTALNKILVLRKAFPEQLLCFADHCDGQHAFASRVPLLATVLGCEFIEKHVCLSRAEAEYDFQSALEISELQVLASELELVATCFTGDFVSESEAYYLKSTLQIPVVRTTLRKGQLISDDDVVYRRTAQPGLTKKSIEKLQDDRFILNTPLEPYSTIPHSAFQRATVGAVVACRLKSSRLKRKALLPIQGMSSVERCLVNCKMFSGVDVVALATSSLEEDSVLRNHTLDGEVEFWQGDPDDVIRRYVEACDALGIDVVVRVTADCPVVSPEITTFLLQRHFSCGADYTAVREGAVGTCAEIYNVEALRRILELIGEAEYSEYMTYYLRNNTDIFKVEIADLPADLVRDYRLTLDYQEDLELFERLYGKLNEREMEPNIRNVFSILDKDPELAGHNSHLTLKYKTDPELVKALSERTRIRSIS